MENTLTVKQLIEQLSKFDLDKPVFLYSVGITADLSLEIPLAFENDTVDMQGDKVNINFTIS